MNNKAREIILLDPNETSNLININLLRYINSDLLIHAFESETRFRSYLKEFRGNLFQIYLHEGFSNDLKSLLFSIFSSQENVELFIISDDNFEAPPNPKIKHMHRSSFIQELTQKLSY